MPIVDVEIVADELAPGLAGRLADGIGEALRAEPGRTWVRLRNLPVDQYAESGGPLPDGVRPVFVDVAARRHPDPSDIAEVAPRICAAVAAETGADDSHVHVVFGEDARGRVAFGGRVVTD